MKKLFAIALVAAFVSANSEEIVKFDSQTDCEQAAHDIRMSKLSGIPVELSVILDTGESTSVSLIGQRFVSIRCLGSESRLVILTKAEAFAKAESYEKDLKTKRVKEDAERKKRLEKLGL